MIRDMARGDFEQWRRLWAQYLHFYRGEVTDEVSAVTFGRLCDRTEGLTGLVAVVAAAAVDDDDDERIVGFAHLVFHPSTWTDGIYCYLEDLFVERPARGSGAAAQLIGAVYQEAERRQAQRVYWETQEFNSPARSLYDTVAHRTSFIIYER